MVLTIKRQREIILNNLSSFLMFRISAVSKTIFSIKLILSENVEIISSIAAILTEILELICSIELSKLLIISSIFVLLF